MKPFEDMTKYMLNLRLEQLRYMLPLLRAAGQHGYLKWGEELDYDDDNNYYKFIVGWHGQFCDTIYIKVLSFPHVWEDDEIIVIVYCLEEYDEEGLGMKQRMLLHLEGEAFDIMKNFCEQELKSSFHLI